MTLFCPAGHGEFEDWVEVCPDCGRRLAAEPPSVDQRTPPDTREPVVFLTRIANEPLAQLSRQVLEDEGIRVMLKPSGPGFGGWGSAANLEHELYVLASHADKAREIISDLEAADGEPFEEEMDDGDTEG